jgi:CHAT domain-containing protein/tetratricopeptide (TPR) repeat protein
MPRWLAASRHRLFPVVLAVGALICGPDGAPLQARSSQSGLGLEKSDQPNGPERQGTTPASKVENRDRQARAERAARRQTADLLRDWTTKLRIATLSPARRAEFDAATRDIFRAAEYIGQVRLEPAEPLLRNALNVYRRVLGDSCDETATCYNNLAVLLKSQGRFIDAEPLYRSALEICRHVLGEDHPSTALSFNNLAANLEAQGRYAEADAFFQTALEIRLLALGPDHTDTAQSFNNLASNLDAQGQFAEAERLYRRALKIYERADEVGNASVVSVLSNLGTNLQDQRRHDEADRALRRALDLCLRVHGPDHPRTATTLNNLANNLLEMGRPGEALAQFEKSLSIRRRSEGAESLGTAQALHNLAVCLYVQGRFAEADSHHRQALAIRRKALGTPHPDTLSSLNGLASNLSASGRFAEAEAVWVEAAGVFALVRLRVSTAGLGRAPFTREQSPSASLAAVLARSRRYRDAWSRLEDGLGQCLLDDLSARQLRPLSEADSRRERVLIEQLQRYDERVASGSDDSARIRRDTAQAELARFEVDLDARYGPAVGIRYDLRQVQAGIPADAALVAWLDLTSHPKAAFPGGEQWACLVRSSGEPVWVALARSDAKAASSATDMMLAERVRRNCSCRPTSPAAPWRDQARELAQRRLAPLVPHLGPAGSLPAVKTLIILPSPGLNGLPIEALVEAWTGAPFAYRVSYAPSGTMLAYLRQRRPRTRESRADASQARLLALGDPERAMGAPAEPAPPVPAPPGGAVTDPRALGYVPAIREPRPTLAPLEGARREVQAVARLFHGPLLLVGPEASERRLAELARSNRLREFDILHFAVHGRMDARLALRSHLFLASDPDTPAFGRMPVGQDSFDGNVTAEQILRTWALDADLVTLSACQSGLGIDSGGEGYLGFAQALFLAGARSLVLSLWEVDDRATSLLMQRFYENLLGNRDGLKAPMPKAEALSEAKAWLRTQSAQDGPTARSEPRKTLKGRAQAAVTRFDHPYYWAGFILIGDPS